jgi:hypothetical protein
MVARLSQRTGNNLLTHGGVQRALQRAEALLLEMPVVESLLARLELDDGSGEIHGLLNDVAAEICADREADGSWLGSVSRTAEQLLLLDELAITAESRALAEPSVGWLLQRLSVSVDPEHSCTPQLHTLGLCTHVTSSFAAVSMRADLEQLRLMHGSGFISDLDARVGVSALAVAALLRWGVPAAEVAAPVSALCHITRLEDRDRAGLLSTNSLACVAAAVLAAAPRVPEAADSVLFAGQALARAQRGDGSWPTGELFFVLSVLVRFSAVAEAGQVVERQLRRSAQLLALMQQADGNWNRGSGSWPLLVGWRTLRAVAGPADATPLPSAPMNSMTMDSRAVVEGQRQAGDRR